ncbi:MAG: hypothetical protein HN580_06075 [Deltaproteobacteria bacterium]|nr:hypothetical protein [Deltaproteobacteria bacterium]MBT4089533.1 hypothetical protein [Deltaproteobacteria bacterium]MBT4268100.1 hypothetical protein [Deltaproteobacteria bacterium]MBT4640271.1 hypothetical protein [Deltaproteobacteria bacterium]MBT6502967.1 hypothetical protein [Deltaproteobacteria bacterium]
MDWKNLNTYFKNIPTGFISDLFEDCAYPWTPLSRLRKSIEAFFENKRASGNIRGEKAVIFKNQTDFIEGAYHITQSGILTEDFVDIELRIYIGSGSFVEAGATIKNHTIIERNCEIRQGAYIRGFVFVGEGSVVGHTTEMKNSVFIKHVEAGHFAYIGDSIVGSYVNLGAGTKISNLEFRSLSAKKNEHFPQIPFRADKKAITTDLSKFGAIIGDGCETGCNSVLCPFVLLAPECWIMPCHCVLKGIYAKGSIIRNRQSKQ